MKQLSFEKWFDDSFPFKSRTKELSAFTWSNNLEKWKNLEMASDATFFPPFLHIDSNWPVRTEYGFYKLTTGVAAREKYTCSTTA